MATPNKTTSTRSTSTGKRTSSGVIEVDSIEDIPMADSSVNEQPTKTKVRRVIPSRQSNIIVNQYDPTEDWEVPHSGTDDPDGGPPKYDESPIAGGHIIFADSGEHVNCNGHEIDPDSGTAKIKAKVLDPDRYKDQTKNDLDE